MDFEEWSIKEYKHWKLFLDQNQYPYLGKCYAWAKRANADLVTDMNQEEREELFETIIPAWKTAIENLYGTIRPNVAILGNLSPHLHAHLVPRCKIPRTIHGIEFIDPIPQGFLLPPVLNKEVPLEIIVKIRDEIKKELK